MSNDYRDEVVAATSLAAFLFVPTGEQVPEITHSLKKCGAERDLPQQVRMKVIGFMEDCGPKQNPTPVIPPPANMWKWKDVDVSTSEIDFATFFGAAGNQGKLWAPTVGKTRKRIPMALHLPLAHVDWFAEQPRTCHEYFLLLVGQITRSNGPVD